MGPLIAKLRAQREFALALDDVRSITLRRPAEAELPALRQMPPTELAKACTVGWAGFTEAFLLGPSVGADEPVSFDAETWAEVVSDRSEWLLKVNEAVWQAVAAHFERKGEAAKN